jgi:peroxiredoxin
MMIETGQQAPNATFGARHGLDVSLSDLWKEGPVVVAFLRHFG